MQTLIEPSSEELSPEDKLVQESQELNRVLETPGHSKLLSVLSAYLIKQSLQERKIR